MPAKAVKIRSSTMATLQELRQLLDDHAPEPTTQSGVIDYCARLSLAFTKDRVHQGLEPLRHRELD